MRDTVQGGGKREKRSRGKRARAGNSFIPDSLYALHLEKRINGDARKSGARLFPLDGRVELFDVCEMTRVNRLFYSLFTFSKESRQDAKACLFSYGPVLLRAYMKAGRTALNTYLKRGKDNEKSKEKQGLFY